MKTPIPRSSSHRVFKNKSRGTAQSATKKSENDQRGLAGINQRTKEARADARLLYKMATEERGSVDKLRSLVRHDSILELILLTIDQAKHARHVVNGIRSRQLASQKKDEATTKVRNWLKNNIHHFTRRPWRKRCIWALKQAHPNLGRGDSWINKVITDFMADKKAGKPFN